MKKIVNLLSVMLFAICAAAFATPALNEALDPFLQSSGFVLNPLHVFAGTLTLSFIAPVSQSGYLFTTVPATEITAIAKWAGKYSTQFLSQMLNGLDVFNDLYAYRNVSRHGVLLPKYTASSGLRPLDPYLEDQGVKERSWSGRKLMVYDCMKLFKFVIDELIGSFQNDVLASGAKEIPFAQWVWSKEMEKLAAEVNDAFYLSTYKADAAAYNASQVADYAVGAYVLFNDDYYKCVTAATTGQSPTTHAAKWSKVNHLVCFDGIGTIIAAEITASNLSPITTGAISASNAIEEVDLIINSMTPAHRAKGGIIHVSPVVYMYYLQNLKTAYPHWITPEAGDGTQYVYGSGKKWMLKAATWMGTSQRIIANVEGKNLYVGTNLTAIPAITNMVPTLHGYKAVSKFLMGSQIGDLECLYVNEQA
jgi:hypothetical protein